MTILPGGLIGGILGFSVVVLGQLPEPEPKKYTSLTCVRLVNEDGTGFLDRDLEAGGFIYNHSQRTMTVLPCVLFADGYEGRD